VTQRLVWKRRPGKRATVLLVLLALLVVAGGTGLWAWNNSRAKEPQVIYVVYDPGSTATHGPTAAPTEGSPSLTAGTSESATALATATTAPAPPGSTPSPKPDYEADPLAGLAFRCNEPSYTIVHIHNRGTGAATRSTSARLTDMYGGSPTYSGVVMVPIIAPGESTSVTFWISVGEGCNETHAMILEIDPDNLVAETDESNNVRHATYLLAGKPDLRTYGITISPTEPKCNEQFTAQITVWNTGTVEALYDVVKFVDTWNGETQATAYVSFPTILAGETAVVHVHFTLTEHCGQHHVIAVEIDPYHRIDEVYETNNTYSKPYVLYAPM
jgi:hypothetical protein